MLKRRLPEKDYPWTPQLAYAVGLLVTDGNLSKDGRHIIMRSAEPLMLETFKQCLCLNSKIGVARKNNGDISYRVQFSNVQFYDWLMRIGLFPAKSYTIGAIKVPNQFFPDYFRGCVDGDGNIRTYHNTYNVYRGRRYSTQSLFIRITSASEKHLIWLQDKIGFLVGAKGAIIKYEPRNDRRAPVWVIQFAKKESLRLIAWMYYAPEFPCLERKRAIAQNALAIINQQKRREYSRI
jgi:hypothetical protein